MTRIYFHPDCLKYNPGPDLSYAPARLTTVIVALKDKIPQGLEWVSAPAATIEPILPIHTKPYLDDILAPIPAGEQRLYDKDTWAVHGTADALLASTGQVLAAVSDVVSARTGNAFCIVSPGGHHAEAETAQGFSFINYVAVAAAFAQREFHLPRVAVVDFDAHHGNGTQSLFWNHADRLLISLHEDSGLSGFADETGSADNILNIPVPFESDGSVYLKFFDDLVAPKLEAFKPDLLLISAGFDAHTDDQLGHLALVETDFERIGQRLGVLAEKLCGGRLVAVMEGGYNLSHLGESVVAFLNGLNGKAS